MPHPTPPPDVYKTPRPSKGRGPTIHMYKIYIYIYSNPPKNRHVVYYDFSRILNLRYLFMGFKRTPIIGCKNRPHGLHIYSGPPSLEQYGNGEMGWFLLVMTWIIPENSLRLAPVSLSVYIYIYNIIQSYIYINQGVGQISATHPPPDNRPCTTAAVDAQWSHLASPPVSFPLLSD